MSLIMNELEKLKTLISLQTQNTDLPMYQLSQLLQTIGAYFYENRFLLHAIIEKENTIHSVEQANRFYTAVEKEIRALIANIIWKGKQQNQFRNIDENFVSYIGFNLLQSLIVTNPFLATSDKTAVNDHTRTFIDLFVNGIVTHDLFSKNSHTKTSSTI